MQDLWLESFGASVKQVLSHFESKSSQDEDHIMSSWVLIYKQWLIATTHVFTLGSSSDTTTWVYLTPHWVIRAKQEFHTLGFSLSHEGMSCCFEWLLQYGMTSSFRSQDFIDTLLIASSVIWKVKLQRVARLSSECSHISSLVVEKKAVKAVC